MGVRAGVGRTKADDNEAMTKRSVQANKSALSSLQRGSTVKIH